MIHYYNANIFYPANKTAMTGEYLEHISKLNLSKKKLNITKIYLLKNDETEFLIHTLQPLPKYISYLKNRKKKIDQKLKEILNLSYEIVFVENFSYFSKNELTNRFQEITNRKLDPNINNALYFESLKKEESIVPVLNQHFKNSNIIKMQYRYCPYDYADLNSKYIFELKSNRYSFNEFENAVINLDKINRISYPYLVLLFNYDEIFFNPNTKKFENKLDTYYILYDEKEFEKYNKRYIHNNTTGLINLVVDIPTKHLQKITPNTSIELKAK